MTKSLIQKNETSLCFLPWAHVYGLSAELNGLISGGAALGLVPHRDQILECLHLLKPSVLLTVPLLLNKVHDGIWKGVAQQSPLKQRIFKYAMKISRKRNAALEFHRPVSMFLEWKYQLFNKK